MIYMLKSAVEHSEDRGVGAELLEPFYSVDGKYCSVFGLEDVGPVSEDKDFSLLEMEVRW